jgi:hypothetical protein
MRKKWALEMNKFYSQTTPRPCINKSSMNINSNSYNKNSNNQSKQAHIKNKKKAEFHCFCNNLARRPTQKPSEKSSIR